MNNCGSSKNECNNNEKDTAESEEIFASQKPYPPVCITERNCTYGRMMLDNIGGANSEMSAVSLYLYNNLLLDLDKYLSYVFHKVSIVEMHHLEIFGQLARLNGENPRLWTHRGNKMQYWSPCCNRYPTELKPLLINALEGEKKAVQKYTMQCEHIKDVHIVKCLKRIILDEELHIEIFESLCKKY